MPPIGRIRRNKTFEDLRRTRIRSRSGVVRVAYVPAAPDGSSVAPVPAEVAYAVGRRCGNAVTRNRLRRRLRAVVASEGDHLAPGAYMVSLSPEAGARTYEELAVATRAALAALRGPSGPMRAGKGRS